MDTECVKEVRCHGYIATRRTARKGHKCDQCGLPIEPKEEYYEVVRGGGGLGWLKFPDRVHIDCLEELLGSYNPAGGEKSVHEVCGEG